MPTDPTTPLQLDQPDTHSTPSIVRAVFAHGFMCGMIEASKIAKESEDLLGKVRSLELRTRFMEMSERGSEVHDRIMNSTPGPKEGADKPDARGGQSSP